MGGNLYVELYFVFTPKNGPRWNVPEAGFFFGNCTSYLVYFAYQ